MAKPHGISVFDINLRQITFSYSNNDYFLSNIYEMDISSNGRFLFVSIEKFGLRILDVSN